MQLNLLLTLTLTIMEKKTFYVFIVTLLLTSLFGCQPIYRVSHRGSGIYTDTIRVIYDDTNVKTFNVPNFN